MTAPDSRATLDDWLGWLPSLSSREIDLGLERVAEVYQRLDIPRPTRVFSVAGTNGKGSTVQMLQALLQSRDVSTGSYTSPHILRYEERIRVNGLMASEASIVDAFRRIESVRGTIPLTYFEYGTLAAMCVFAEREVDTALLEVGLGGRLDAVNAIDHDGCIITNVSLDHCDWLGDTLGEIALEKAGIMRQGKPAIVGDINAPPELAAVARTVNADLRAAGRDFHWREDADGAWCWQGRDVTLDGLAPLQMRGDHQLDNAAAALALLEAVGLQDQLCTASVNAALPTLQVAGRQELLVRRDRYWLMDGAHNEEGARALGDRLAALKQCQRALLVVGVLDDKDVDAIVAQLVPHVSVAITLTADSPRAVPAARLKSSIAAVGDLPVTAVDSPEAALGLAVTAASPDDLIVVAGSFYTLATAYRWLGDTIE